MSDDRIVLDVTPKSAPPRATATVIEDRRAGSNDAALEALVNVTRRRLSAIDRRNAPSAIDRFERFLIESVYAVILAATVTGWAVLGFVVWVPLLVRNTILMAGTVFYVSLFRDYANMANAQRSLHVAVRLYARGFEHFFEFYRRRGEPETPVGLFEPLTSMTRDDLLVESVWVGSVWMAAMFAMNAATSALFWLNRTLPY
jgi:hypothetical protein